MAQFDVYRNRDRASRRLFPLVVDVQVDLLRDLRTRVVIPLLRGPPAETFPLMYLTPTVTVDARSYVVMTPQLTGISRGDLGPHVGSLVEQSGVISSAVQFLVRGF